MCVVLIALVLAFGMRSQPADAAQQAPNGQAATAVSVAYAQLGKPYIWGGAGPNSFDCSGLTMYAWAAAGVALDHYTGSQYNQGVHVSQAALLPGDLVFFYPDISHEGIYVGDGYVIHAPHTGAVVSKVPLSYFTSYYGATRPVPNRTPAPPVPAPSSSCHAVLLRQGSGGTCVVLAQQRLGGLVADGAFGPLTYGVVTRFQASHGLVVDGVIGPQTWTALGV